MFASPSWAAEPRYAALLAEQRWLRQAGEAAAAGSAAYASAEGHLAAAAGCLHQAVAQVQAAGLTGDSEAWCSASSSPLLHALHGAGSPCSRRQLHQAYCRGRQRPQHDDAVQQSAARQAAQYVQQAARLVQTAQAVLPWATQLPGMPQADVEALSGGLFLGLFADEAVAGRAWAALGAASRLMGSIQFCELWCFQKQRALAQQAAAAQAALQAKEAEAKAFMEAAVAAALRQLADAEVTGSNF
ncbi:hypothetical protein ABPG75_010247 [Micractinium tetrahymenae]